MQKIGIVAGVARSGTSWLGQIIDSSPEVSYRFQPIFSYAFKNAINEDSSKEEIQAFFTGVNDSQDDFLTQSDKREAGLYPTFEKLTPPALLVLKLARHQYVLATILRFFEQVKLIAIVRNPCGVINSWLQNPADFPPGSDVRAEWRFGACKNAGLAENFYGYYKWKEVANMYLDLKAKHPDRVIVVNYDELVDNTVEVATEVFDFLDLSMGEQSQSFIHACHSKHHDNLYSVFKDKSVKDRWRKELDPYIISEIHEDLKDTRLGRFIL